MKTPLIYSAS